jgi:hypothetical protein
MANLVVAKNIPVDQTCYGCELGFNADNLPMVHEGDLGDKHDPMHYSCWRKWVIRKAECPHCKKSINPAQFSIAWTERLRVIASDLNDVLWSPYVDFGRRLRAHPREVVRVFLANGAIAGMTTVAARVIDATIAPLTAATGTQLFAQLPNMPLKGMVAGTVALLALTGFSATGAALALGMNATQVAKKIVGTDVEAQAVGIITGTLAGNHFGLSSLTVPLMNGLCAGIWGTWRRFS